MLTISRELDAFFDKSLDFDPAAVDNLTDQLERNGTERFRAEVPGMLPVIPVLVDGEKGLEHTFGIIARQQPIDGRRQPSIIVAANVTEGGVNRAQYQENTETGKRFTSFCSDRGIAFSHCFTTYPSGAPIGAIRADMHASQLNYYRRQTASPDDILLLSGDADFQTAESDYWWKMQRAHARSNAAAWMGGPAVLHALLGPEYPRIDSLLIWYDYTAQSGGIPRDADYAEVAHLARRLAKHFDSDYQKEDVDSTVTVSPRQLVSQIQGASDVVDYTGLYTAPHRSPQRGYRSESVAADISPERFAEVFPGILKIVGSESACRLGTQRQARIDSPEVREAVRAELYAKAAKSGDTNALITPLLDRYFGGWK